MLDGIFEGINVCDGKLICEILADICGGLAVDQGTVLTYAGDANILSGWDFLCSNYSVWIEDLMNYLSKGQAAYPIVRVDQDDLLGRIGRQVSQLQLVTKTMGMFSHHIA